MGAHGQTARAEAEIAASARPTRAWIPTQALGRARPAIEALSERGRRFGTGPIELCEIERGKGEVLVELSGEPPRLQGWEVVGRLEHRDGDPGRVVFAGAGRDRGAWSGAQALV